MLGFGAFCSAIIGNPTGFAAFLLVCGCLFVNGATDASNAIAPLIGTRAMRPGPAIAMGAVCNFIGLVLVSLVTTAVANTISGIVDFGGDAHATQLALCAALASIITWGGIAWFLGIPTSQSHSLIAGLTGAAIAIQGGLAGVSGWEWLKVVYGLVLSTGLGFFAGWALAKVTTLLARTADRTAANRAMRPLQIGAAAFLALMHGAQDGQKFLSVALLVVTLALASGFGSASAADPAYPLWLVVVCAAVLALGSGVGGKRIIKNVGASMVKMEPWQGLDATLATAASVLLATLAGLPISTTHTSTTAVMGVGAAKRMSAVRWGLAKNMLLVWLLTFPACGFIGFGLTLLLTGIF